MMARDPRFDLLFQPIAIGPVTAKNRFYQVPHCSGMGMRHPKTDAVMRGVKAQGGWGVVCTQECEIHANGDISPTNEARLWDDDDMPALELMVEAVHEHGALAGIELTHNGPTSANLYSREVPLAPSDTPISGYDPVQARMMTKRDIGALREWHRAAALRAMRAGFDIVYVYAGHDLAIPMHFLSRSWNRRTDEYGGSIENRARLLRELVEDTKDAVGHRCGVAVRFAVDELRGESGITAAGEGREVVEMLAELPDLWDVNISDWSNDSETSRFGPEGAQEPFISFVKQATSKPVVGVGRFTSPDAMLSQLKRGLLDIIGAARPSIADPFLPKKIEEGRVEDIRECIGCNMCVSGDVRIVPMRCTQNPTVGEEWRRGWHPERIEAAGSQDTVLVVGAGPAGLECARALGQRGYQVTLAEARGGLGGRVSDECALPGLAAWGRVRDYRVYQIGQMVGVETYLESQLRVEDILEFGFKRVVIATGARWRRDGLGRAHREPVPGSDMAHVLTPDDIIGGCAPAGPVIVYDDDHYYMGGVLAEYLQRRGLDVTLVTPAADVSHWTHNTLEQLRIQRMLLELGVEILSRYQIGGIERQRVSLECVYTGRRRNCAAASVVMVTSRFPEDSLYQALVSNAGDCERAGILSVDAIGDCVAPGTIAAAVYSGHRFARELDASPPTGVGFRRELAMLS